MIEKAMAYAKNPIEEKVGFSFQIPVSMKKEFERVCKLNNVTMTNMILGLIKATNEEYPDYNQFGTGELLDMHMGYKHEVKGEMNALNSIQDHNLALHNKQFENVFNFLDTQMKHLKEIEKVLDERGAKYSKYGENFDLEKLKEMINEH